MKNEIASNQIGLLVNMYGTRSQYATFGKRKYGSGLPKLKLYRSNAVRTKFRGTGSPTTTQTRTRSGTIESSTTDNYDKTVRYVRKRMPRYKRKRWVGFTRKVQHVQLQMNPLRIYQCAEQGVWTGTSQITFGTLLYDQLSNAADVQNIFKDAYGGAGGLSDYLNKRIYLKSASLDFQIVNSSATNSNVLDVYEIRARKPCSQSYADISAMWADTFSELSGVGAVSLTYPAMTLFDNPNFLKHFLVVKKTEYICDAGKLVTLNLRRPRNGYISGRQMEQNLTCIPGWTVGYVVQVRGQPANSVNPAGLASSQGFWSVQKSYHYALPPGADNSETVGQSK